MKRRLSCPARAVFLTILYGAVAVGYSAPMWIAWSGEILARGLLIVLAALGATSLANVWFWAAPSLQSEPKGRSAGCSRNAMSMAKMGGGGNV